MRDVVFFFLLTICHPILGQDFSSDFLPYQSADQVWEDLNAGLLDSVEAWDLLDLFEHPVRLSANANLNRLLAVPGIVPGDLALLRVLLEAGRSPIEHEKWSLIEPMVEQGSIRGGAQIWLSPSWSRQNDFRKRGQVQNRAGPMELRLEAIDDTFGTYLNTRSLLFETRQMRIAAGNFLERAAKGILLGDAYPRPIHRPDFPADFGRSLIDPLSYEPDGLFASVSRLSFQAAGYVAQLNAESNELRVIGSYAQYQFPLRKGHVGIQTQDSPWGTTGGFYFGALKDIVSGEIVFSEFGGAAWVGEFNTPDRALNLMLYRYPEGAQFPLGNPTRVLSGSIAHVDDESLRVSASAEQGVQITETYGKASIRLRAWQIPGAPETGAEARASTRIPWGKGVRSYSTLALRRNLDETLMVRPEIGIARSFGTLDIETGIRERAVWDEDISTTVWLGTAFRPNPINEFRLRYYLNQDGSTVSQRIWAAYETGVGKRANIRASLGVPLEETGSGWASVRMGVQY